jgi:Ku protein
MPARPTWKGYLKISLVNIPIKVFPATDAGATLSFNQLHGECQTRIQQKRWCPKCEREVPNTDIVKGFEFEKGRYVVVDEEDIDKVRVDSTRVINLEKFTDDTAIDPIYLERPYYLAPDGPVAREAFAVIREGMKGKAGIGKVALYGREYLVKVQPREKGLVMYTLRHANEIRSMDAIDELSDMPAKVKPEEVKLAHQVMGTFEGTVDLQEYRDDYQVGLREIIDAKIEGREIVAPEVEAPPKVVNLMEALRKSLDAVSARKKTPAKAVLDISAGHGLFGITIADHYRQAHVTALDWPSVLAVAAENARRAGVTERYSLLPGSAFDVAWGGPYDVVLLTNFLHHFEVPTCEQLAARAYAALAPGGRALTLEFIPEPDRITPPSTANFALVMLATTAHGDAYTFAEFQTIFARAGFRRNEFHALPPTTQQAVVSFKG